MASPIGSLSYLYPSAYPTAAPAPVSSPAITPAGAPGSTASATAELQAMQQQDNFQNLLNDSMAAAALLQPSAGVNSGAAMTTLVNNMLQEVLGAYQAQSTPVG